MSSMLNKRLEMISAFIDFSDAVIDIGCDHGLLGIYLSLYKHNQVIVSSDIHEKPLEAAKHNLSKYHLEDKISLRLGDGLTTITDDIDTIVISGMGGVNIVNILSDIAKYPYIQKIIVSPNSDVSLTRKEITKLGFHLVREELVKEKSKYYVISEYQKGYGRCHNYFGKLDLSNELVREYYQNIYQKNQAIMKKLSLFKKLTKFNLYIENLFIKTKLK